MTLKEFRELTKDMPGDLEMVMSIGDGMIVPVCKENSRVLDMQHLDQDEFWELKDDTFVNDFINKLESDLKLHENEPVDLRKVLMLVPCSCGDDDLKPEVGEINGQPELN